MKMILYHNNNCSKSRECLNILTKKNIDFKVRHYMKDKLTFDEINNLLENLSSDLKEVIRDKKLFDTQRKFSINHLSKHLLQNPQNMQRPIFFDGKNYLICRPPELVKEII